MVLSIVILTFQGKVAALNCRVALFDQQQMWLVRHVCHATFSSSLYIGWRCHKLTFAIHRAGSARAISSRQLFHGPCSASLSPNMIYIQVPRASGMLSHKPTYTGTSL